MRSDKSTVTSITFPYSIYPNHPNQQHFGEHRALIPQSQMHELNRTTSALWGLDRSQRQGYSLARCSSFRRMHVQEIDHSVHAQDSALILCCASSKLIRKPLTMSVNIPLMFHPCQVMLPFESRGLGDYSFISTRFPAGPYVLMPPQKADELSLGISSYGSVSASVKMKASEALIVVYNHVLRLRWYEHQAEHTASCSGVFQFLQRYREFV